MPPIELLDPVDVMSDEEFELDLTVIESTTPLVTTLCATDDNCGSTCEKSACATHSAHPF